MQINMTKDEFRFMLEAISEKYERMLLGFLKKEPIQEEETTVEELKKEFERMESAYAYKPVAKQAPYGVKKDGTPKKKSGRPTKEFF